MLKSIETMPTINLSKRINEKDNERQSIHIKKNFIVQSYWLTTKRFYSEVLDVCFSDQCRQYVYPILSYVIERVFVWPLMAPPLGLTVKDYRSTS